MSIAHSYRRLIPGSLRTQNTTFVRCYQSARRKIRESSLITLRTPFPSHLVRYAASLAR